MIPQHVKRQLVVPKVYAVLIKSPKGRVMHFGVHFSLDEAFGAARKTLDALSPLTVGDTVDIDMWHSMTAEDVLNTILEDDNIKLMRVPDDASPVEEVDVPEYIKAIFGAPAPQEAPPTFETALRDVKKAKNDLIQGLIRSGDATKVVKIGSLLTPHEKRYILKKISEKAPNTGPEDPNVDNQP